MRMRGTFIGINRVQILLAKFQGMKDDKEGRGGGGGGDAHHDHKLSHKHLFDTH